ncbi:hypothetical protein ABZ807_27490 [Micromonospora sp. NPDC047548]|uniref:hypothetical protein n=1 Tax=Micromonospora sp. NPDC047548 TaxID=3155624 RepID=UPI0033FC0A00
MLGGFLVRLRGTGEAVEENVELIGGVSGEDRADLLSSGSHDLVELGRLPIGSKATAANYRDALLPVGARLGEKPLQDVTEVDIEALVDWMLTEGRRRGGKPGSGLGVRSVRLTLGRLRTALNVAVRRQLVVRNVAAFVTIPRAAAKAAADARA